MSSFTASHRVSRPKNHCLIFLLLSITVVVNRIVLGDEEAISQSQFRIIIDGGSTGSRLHLFEFVKNSPSSNVECLRRGSWKAHTPLSSFGRLPSEITTGRVLNSRDISNHLIPLFEQATAIIPPEHYTTTSVHYKATAGMRLLEESEQNAVYDALYEGLMNATFFNDLEIGEFPFRRFERENVATLSGEKEGFFAAVAANFLAGAVDVHLNLKYDEHRVKSENNTGVEMRGAGRGPLGALDMGGASAQIVYLPSSGSCAPNVNVKTWNEEEMTCNNNDTTYPDRLEIDDFFSISHLSYGVDPVREKLWDMWIDDQQNTTTDADIIPNPCAFKGQITEWREYTLIGTGNATECSRHVRRIIPSFDDHSKLEESIETTASEINSRKVNGVEHPPLRGKFLAMSNFFFSLDSLRALSHPKSQAHRTLNEAWPNPTVEELENALDGFCSRSWQGDLEEIQHNAHSYTRADVLPHRCLESVYIVNLLRHGFGFDPSARDITYAYDIAGSEVEWTLGMALWLFAQETATADDSLFNPTTQKKSNDTADSCPFDGRGHIMTSGPYQ